MPSPVDVQLCAAALGAVGLAAVVGPPDRGKLGAGFLVRHASNGRYGERPCCAAEEEVLGHRRI